MIVNVNDNKKNGQSLISADSYIRIYGFMRQSMGLEKTELLVYALVYSYFRNGDSLTGTIDYIAEWVGSGRSAVSAALASLVDKGYITKVQRCSRGLRYVEYNVNPDALPESSEHVGMLKLWREDKRKRQYM